MSYFKKISDDFQELSNVLISEFGEIPLTDGDLKNLKNYHQSLIIIKDLLEDLRDKLDPNVLKSYELSIVDFLDYIWLLYLGRYKPAIASLRTGMDIFTRATIRTIDPNIESDSFSQNLRLTLKAIRIKNETFLNLRRDKKKHKKYIEDTFTEPLIAYYGLLSNSIHGKESLDLDLPLYINDVLNTSDNFDEVALSTVNELGQSIINLLLQVFIILNLKLLNKHSNLYKLELVISRQEEGLKKYKYEFLRDFEYDDYA